MELLVRPKSKNRNVSRKRAIREEELTNEVLDVRVKVFNDALAVNSNDTPVMEAEKRVEANNGALNDETVNDVESQMVPHLFTLFLECIILFVINLV